MSTPSIAAPPVVDEAHAHARLDALIAEHGLPEPENVHLQHHDAEHLRICVGIDPAVLHVRVTERAEVAQWAAVLGVQAETQHTIHEYADGRWCAVWRVAATFSGWLPGVKLSVTHSEDRWIDAPTVTR